MRNRTKTLRWSYPTKVEVWCSLVAAHSCSFWCGCNSRSEPYQNFMQICLPYHLGTFFLSFLNVMNANSSSGFKIQESYECFEIEYNAFIDKFEQKGSLPSAAHVDSRSAQWSLMIIVHRNVDIHLFVIGSFFKSSQVRFFSSKMRQLATTTSLDWFKYSGTTTGPFKTGLDLSKFQGILCRFGWDMVKTEGTYICVVYKNVFGHISTNSWLCFIIQRPTIR